MTAQNPINIYEYVSFTEVVTLDVPYVPVHYEIEVVDEVTFSEEVIVPPVDPVFALQQESSSAWANQTKS